MTERRPIGAVDTIWLNMDRPNNLMVIDAVMWFDKPVDWDRFTTVLRDRLVGRYPVFRQRPVDPPLHLGLPHWEDDPDFDLARHVIRVQLAEPGDDAALQRYIESQVSLPLDRQHPLWQYHLISGYGSGAAVMCRFHHSLADGAALTEVLLSTTDATPEGDEVDPKARPRRKVAARSSAAASGAPHAVTAPHDAHAGHGGATGEALAAGQALLGAASKVASSAGSAARTALHLLSELPHLANPTHLVDALTLTQQTGHIANKLLLGGSPPPPFDAVPGTAKRVTWSPPRPLDEIKQAGKLAGATINDVIVTALAGAVCRYMAERGVEPEDLVTMVPVNLRPPGQPLPPELGNMFALVMLELPSAARAPLERLAVTKHRMDVIKKSPEAVLTFGMIQAIGWTMPDIERVIVNFFSNKAFGVTTNVVGPREDRYVGGARMTGVLGWVPGSGNHSVGTCILTYDGTVQVGFKVDAGIVPDPEKLVVAFDEAMDDLLQITGQRAARPDDTPAADAAARAAAQPPAPEAAPAEATAKRTSAKRTSSTRTSSATRSS